jgi:phosphatidylinositol alpha 1,6-mannosyltransferase
VRIAVVSEGYFPEVSGVTVAVAQHLRYLAARGHDVLLAHPRYPDEVRARMGAVSSPDGDPRRFLFDSDPIAPHRAETRVPSRAGAAALDAAIARFSPAAVLYHNPDRLVPELAKVWRPRRVAGLSAARRAGATVIPLVHTLLPLFVERSGSRLWRTRPAAALTRYVWSGIYNDNFDFAVTVDAAARDYLSSVGFRIPILAGPYNGVDTDVFRARPAPPPLADGDALRVAWIGRLVHEKNASLLPDFARALAARGVRFELTIIGDGPLAPWLARALAPWPSASLRGWLAPPDVAAELARAHLYLSLSDTESYSLTASEALATGVPVVAPDVIGFRRLGPMKVGALFPAALLDAPGMAVVAALVASSRPSLGAWSRAAAAAAPGLAWDRALDALYGDLAARTRLPFVP